MLQTPSQSDGIGVLSLPPAFAAREAVAPWRVALAEAEAGQSPGTLIYAPIGSLLEAALILTPDRPASDETVLRLATVATQKALLALVPPKTPVTSDEPGIVMLDGGEIASMQLARGPTLEGDVPAWIVLGLTIRLDIRLEAPGATPWLTDLAEQGVETSGPALLESLSRHLLSMIDLWLDEGDAGIARAWRANG